MSNAINDSGFSVKEEGPKGVILYPALTTPCLVDRTGKMLVIVAVHQLGLGRLQKLTSDKIKINAEIPVEAAVKLHSHLRLVPWGKNYADIHPLYAEIGYRAHFREMAAIPHLIYGGHAEAKNKYEDKEKAFYAWYLGEMSEPVFSKSIVDPLYINTKEKGKIPFGKIGKAARKMYKDKGYIHLFQLEFSDFPVAKLHLEDASQKALYELVWVWGDSAGIIKKSYVYEKPNDTVLLQNYANNLNEENGNRLLEPNVNSAPRKYIDGGEGAAWPDNSKDLDMYRLLNPGTKTFPQKEYPEGYPQAILDILPAMRQDGAHLLLSRHPVFICGKNALEIGIVGDMHISARQAAYKLTHCQVIPGADIKDSPYIGQTSNEFLLSARSVMDKVVNICDTLVIIGDIIDHDTNLYMKHCAGHIRKTGDLWNYIEYGKHKKEYARRIDGIMILELILECYNNTRNPVPVFFVTGNHEAYLTPYGISPRVLEPFIGRVNEGIPGDHNLTIYEAALLYGKTYADCTWFNFKKEIHDWYSQVFSPWEDVLVTHGEHNFIFFCWGEDEGYVKSKFEGGKTLPRSYGPVTDDQLKMLLFAAAQAETKKNILFTHFTYISYDQLLPLKTSAGKPNGGEVTIGASRFFVVGKVVDDIGVILKNPYVMAAGKAIEITGETESAFCETNLGSFTNNLREVFSLLVSNKIQYTVSGHAHRSCAYEYDYLYDKVSWTLLTVALYRRNPLSVLWDAITLQKKAITSTYIPVTPIVSPDSLLPEILNLPAKKTVSIVTGSAGPMCIQNMERELGGFGLDEPQGMVFSPGSNQLRIVRAKRIKPRLAAVAGALQDIAGIYPFDDERGTFEKAINRFPFIKTDKVATTGTMLIGKYFYVTLNKKWMDIFGGCPFNMLKVHAVINANGKPVSTSFTLYVKNVDGQEVMFEQTADDFDEFYNDVREIAKESPFSFFMSMHFFDTFLRIKNKYFSLYNLSPWSFPIIFGRSWTLISWNRPRLNFIEQELPDFEYYEKFIEYQKRKY